MKNKSCNHQRAVLGCVPMRSQMTVASAAAFLERGTRRVYQLLVNGELEVGDFQGSILTSSLIRYKRKLDNGTVRRGRPNGNSKKKAKR